MGQGLGRTRRMATAVLILLILGFFGSHLLPDSLPTRLMRAMCEAGMIGGLADWFAVEALFRRPLGLPIPHTALLPRKQQRAAQNVGRFFVENFLDPARIALTLQAVQPAARILAWLAQPGNARRLTEKAQNLSPHLLTRLATPRLLARLRRGLRAGLQSPKADALIASMLARMAREGLQGPALTALLVRLHQAVDQNRDIVTGLVQSQSRWWIAGAVDRRMANAAVTGILGLLNNLQDPQSPLRVQLEQGLHQALERSGTDGTLLQVAAAGRAGLIRSGVLDDLFRSAISALGDAASRPSDALGRAIAETAQRIAADKTALAALDAQLGRYAARALTDLRPLIATYLAQIIAGWKPDELIARFEAEIGDDLQYIRINGAVLGALIGGVLFGINQMLT